MALAVFALAFIGLAAALDAGIGAGLVARDSSRLRHELENRFAYCLADPPKPNQKRVIEAKENHGVRSEESLEPFEAKNAKGEPLGGLWTLKIKIVQDGMESEAETLIYMP